MATPLSERFNKRRMHRSTECHGKSHKKFKKTAANNHSLLKQKWSSKVVPKDFDKIITFLTNIKTPQHPLCIAKACGYNTAKDINPTLYDMMRQNLVQKIRDSPPAWTVYNTVDLSTNVSSPIKEQFQQMANKPIQNEERGRFHNQNKSKHGKIATEKPSNSGSVRGRTRSNSVSKFSQASVTSHETGMSHQQISHENLFKKTINDYTAPGAYNKEHSHEKRLDTYNCHRKHSPNYPSKLSSEQHVLEMPTVFHEHTKDEDLSSIECDGVHGKDDDSAGPLSIHLVLNSPSATASLETNMPLTNDTNIDMITCGDDSEYTDDDDYDLNFRISDVVSIRDPDLRNDLAVVKNTDKTFIHKYKLNEASVDSEQDTEVNMCDKFSDVDVSESDHEEVWVGDGFLGPTIHSKLSGSKKEADAIQKVLDSNVLKQLNAYPFRTTMKSILASALSMAQGDLQKLLDTCLKEGWIEYTPLDHIRLTDAGVNILKLEQQEQYSSMMQPNSGPPLHPDQFLKNISKIHGSTLQLTDLPNASQYSACKVPEHPQDQSNSSVCSMSHHVNSVQEINNIRNKNLMPWLPSKLQVPDIRQVAYSPELNNTTVSSSELSFLSAPQTRSYSQPSIPSTFRQHLLTDNKSGIPYTEWPAFLDVSDMNQRMCKSLSLQQQEQVQMKRAPLLSTPDTRGSSSSPKSLPGTGKVALLPYPGQFTQQLHQQFKVSQLDTPTNLQISTESFAALNKNPISAFMEYGQCRHTPARIEVLSQRGPSHKPVFTIAAMLGSRVFPGITSSNKKDGKKDAAEQAIRILIAEGQYNMPANSSVMSIPESSMTQFDKIAALTHHKFNQLIAVIPESLVGRKVIAGLVMKMDEADTGTVISVGSGNRCITGDKLSLKGFTVNDCHAEIITRRGFLRFLHHQLKSYNPIRDHPLFEKSPTGKLRIKKSVTFHLYISTAPCGDGALFSPRDVESNNVALTDSCTRHRPTFETNVQGVLRTKMEGGEGTIPLDPEKPVQTWDGIVRGERLRTMSCSDKICRWNVVGIQGALLANFLDPIYLNSITLGFLFDAGHLSRAVCCRLNRGEPLERDLLPPYHLNHPVLGRVTACDATRETQKTKSYSINWMVEDDKPEIVDGCQGTCYTGDKSETPQASRLCKKSMFHCFRQTCQNLGQRELLSVPTYYKAKRMCPEFLQAKQAMIKKFRDTNCGIWLGKPAEEEMFS